VRLLIRAIDGLSRACGALAAALVLILIVLMVYDAVLRYAFSAPTIWAFEVATYLMGALFVLAIGYALECDAHVRVDLLYDWLPRRLLTWVDLVGFTALLLPVLVLITHGCWEYFLEAYKSGERSGGSAWNPKVWPFRLVLFVGFTAFTLQVVAEIVKRVTRLRGRPIASADPPTHDLPT
jgi:TRAP-type mannitol/chloroaromatic compound transport system permease small subunit